MRNYSFHQNLLASLSINNNVKEALNRSSILMDSIVLIEYPIFFRIMSVYIYIYICKHTLYTYIYLYKELINVIFIHKIDANIYSCMPLLHILILNKNAIQLYAVLLCCSSNNSSKRLSQFTRGRPRSGFFLFIVSNLRVFAILHTHLDESWPSSFIL